MIAIICPRECSKPTTVHCCGWLRKDGHARCWHCGRFMPLDEAIDMIDMEATA